MNKTIVLIKKIDQFIGPILIKILPKQSLQKKSYIHKQILIIRPGGMGDALLLLPALKELYKATGFSIDVLCEPRNETIFKNTSFIKSTYSYQNPVTLLKILFKPYDILIDTEQSHFLSAIIARLARAAIKAGFKTCSREKMYTLSVCYRHDRYVSVVRCFSVHGHG